MHEHGIADRLLGEARARAEQRGFSKLTQIVIGVGALSGLSRDTLAEPLHHAAEEAGLTGVQFVFEEIPPAAVCTKCGKDTAREAVCPRCGSEEIEVTGGTDVTVIGLMGAR